MTKNSETLLSLCIVSMLAVSCMGIDAPFKDRNDSEPDAVVIPVSLSCEPLDTETGASISKSMHDISTLRRISNANYYVFHEGSLVKQGYFDDAGDFAVSLPSKNEEYNLYILANVGKMAVESDTRESSMASAVHVDYGDRENYFSTIEGYGFPMSLIVNGFKASSSADIRLRRLVHTLYVTVDTDALESTKMTFTGLSIRNAARDIYPFASESKAKFTIDGDASDIGKDDLEALNRGETVALYLLENMRGILFPGNSDWKMKVPDLMSPKTEQPLTSYMEVTAEVQTATAHYGHNTYRAYIGTSPSDCNVKRHSYFELENRFTNDMVENDGWRIEEDEPVVNQELAFVDTRYTDLTAPNPSAKGDVSDRPFRHVEQFYTMNGFVALYYIYQSHPGMKYSVSMVPNNDSSTDCGNHIQYELRKVDDNFSALIVRTTYPVNDDMGRYTSDPSFDSGKSVTFKIKSNDGLISDELVCKVLEYPLSMKFRYEGVPLTQTGIDGNRSGRFNMYFTNPLNLYVGVNMEGKVHGICVHRPNGTIGAEKTKKYDVTVNTGNRHADGQPVAAVEYNSVSTQIFDVAPVTGRATRIDMYTPKLEVGVGTFYREIAGFHEYFMEIWNNTAWNDYTFFGTSGHYKHAEPNKIELDMDILFLSPNPNRLCPLDDVPVYIENDVPGTDAGFIFHHSNTTDYSKTIEFNTSESFSLIVNNVADWRSGQVTVNRRKRYGDDYGFISEAMINHELNNSL